MSSPSSDVQNLPTQSPPAQDTPAIAAVRNLLKETLRIVTSDNRVFIGTFVGTDQLLNLLLVNTEEYILGTGVPAGRFVGQVMVPWRLIGQVEALSRSHNEQGKRRDQNGGGLYI